MADITMCTNKDCHLSDMCWRFCAPPDLEKQSYGEFSPDENGDCEHLIYTDEVSDEEFISAFI